MRKKVTGLYLVLLVLIAIVSVITGCQAAPVTITATSTKTTTQTTTAVSTQTTTATATTTAIATTTATATVTATPTTTTRTPRTLRIDGDNLGFPQPYTGSTMGRAYLYMSLIFDTLAWKDQAGVVPLLGQSWTVSVDQKTWIFKLVQNAKFTDGKPLTANDVKFSFDYIKKYPNKWVQLGMIDAVTVIDNYTVQFALTAPYAPFLTDVAGLVPIMPQHIWSSITEPAKFTTPDSVIGSGPFKLTSFDSATGTYIYEANKDYFLGMPVVDKLIYSPNSNSNQALLNGDIDTAQYLTYAQALALKLNSKYRLIEGPGLFIARLYFNFDLPEFKIVNLRQAFYYAINRQEIVQKALSNGGTPGNPGYVAPDSIWFNPNIAQYTVDLNKAKQLLEANSMLDSNGDGIREYNGKPMQYEFLITANRLGEAQLMVSYLNQIGIKLTIKTVDQSTLNSQIQSGTFQLAFNGHGSMGGDPVMLANFVSPSVTLGTTPLVTRQGGAVWGNTTFDSVFVKQLSEMDSAKRQELVNQLQQILADELPALPIYYMKITIGWNPATLNGWFFTAGGVGPSVPTAQNKLVFIRGWWGQ